jgi:hypothetical protein
MKSNALNNKSNTMKKLFMTVLAVLVMASCGSNDGGNSNGAGGNTVSNNGAGGAGGGTGSGIGDNGGNNGAGGAANAECAAEQLLIPGAATISFNVDIIVGGKVVSTAPYTFSTTLAAANAYNFNINVSVGDPIQFSVEKNPEWTNNDPVDIN